MKSSAFAARSQSTTAYPATPPIPSSMPPQTRTVVVYAMPYAYARSGAPLFLEVRPEHAPVVPVAPTTPSSTQDPLSWAQFLSLQPGMTPSRTELPATPPPTRLPPRGRPAGRASASTAAQVVTTPSPCVPARIPASSPLPTPKTPTALNRKPVHLAAPRRGPSIRKQIPATAREAARTPESVRLLPLVSNGTPTPESFRRPAARTLPAPLRAGRGLLPSIAAGAVANSTPSPVSSKRAPRSTNVGAPRAGKREPRSCSEAARWPPPDYASDGSSAATISEDGASAGGSPAVPRRGEESSIGRIQRFARSIARGDSAADRVAASAEMAAARRPRVVWAGPLEERFEEALRALGVDTALPRQVLTRMNVPGLTRKHVSSHLQKYRAALEKERERVRTETGPSMKVDNAAMMARKRKREENGGGSTLPPKKQQPWRQPAM